MPVRHRLVLAAAATAAALAAPSPAGAAAGWQCAADGLGGVVLGTAIPRASLPSSASAPCATRQAVRPLAVPPATPLLDVAAVRADTHDVDGGAVAVGGVADLRVRALPSLPIALPQLPALPESLTSLDLGLLEVDLTPAIAAARKLPTAELLRIEGALAYAGGRCEDGAPELTSTAHVAGVSVLGESLGSPSLLDREVTVPLDPVQLQELDLTLATVTSKLTGTAVTITPTLLDQIEALVAGLGPQAIPVGSLPARVVLTPGAGDRTADAVLQRALRVSVSLAGTTLADLVLGQAAISSRDVDCAPAQQPPATPPAAEQPDATDLALACTRRRIVLIDVLPRGSRVQLLGAADKSLVGRTVRIVFAATGRTVARATVRPDGSFSTRAPMPHPSVAGTNRARYRAVLGDERSLNLKLTRRMVVDSVTSRGGRVRIRGRVIGPLASPPRPIVVKRRVTCAKTRTIARVRPRPDGRFSISVKAPADQAAAVFRLQTKVLNTPGNPRLYPTFTLPRAVNL